MNKLKNTTVAVTLVLMSASLTHAQSSSDEDIDRSLAGPVRFNIAGALFLPTGDSGSRLDTGRGFTAGVAFHPHSAVGLLAEYGFSYSNVRSAALDASSTIDGNQTMSYGTLDLVLRPMRRSRFGFYLLGGPGVYYRNVEITRFEGTATTYYCDPWVFACGPADTPVEDVIGSADSFDFGLNGGLGVYAVIEPPLSLYLEARYHYIWGPAFTTQAGKSVNADGQYVAVALGFRF